MITISSSIISKELVMGYIYKITNTVTGKCYIGETIQHDYESRWRKHRNSIKYKEGCPVLKASMKKYGLDKFKFEIILICFDEDLLKYEREYIKKYNAQIPNGYNILPGGQLGDGMLGYKHTEESIQKIKEGVKRFREANPNYFETYREKLKESMKNVNISECMKNSKKFQNAIKEKRVGANSHKDRKISDSTKQKISEGLKKHFQNNETDTTVNIKKHRESMTKALGKPIAQYTLNGEFIKEYRSTSEAGRTSSVKKSNIQHALSGSNKTAGGFIWKFVSKI